MIYVCTLTREGIDVNTVCDLIELMRSNSEYYFAAIVGAYVHTLREGAASAIAATGATHVCFIDSDMMFPRTIIEQLLARDKDIIASNYVQRIEHDKWIAMLNGECVSSVGRTGIQEVDIMGMGATLIKTDVFKKIPPPWFDMAWKNGSYTGEDIAFCNLVRKYGYKTWIDHDLSQEVHHIGLTKLGVDNYLLPEYTVPDIDGWMNPAEMRFLYNQAKYMSSIAELGCWKGRSTHALASGCKGKLWCIDHWKGNSHTPLERGAQAEDIYAEFLKNTKQFKNVNVLKMSTDDAAAQFADKSLDMVFIDAGHEYAEVANDIEKWYPKARVLLCGHDYSANDFPEVVKAVNDKFGRPDRIFETLWLKKI